MALKTYQGSCRCGKVTFEAKADLEQGTGRCNCTMCTKSRNWSAIIKPEDLISVTGREHLSDYGSEEGDIKVHNYFCKYCGVRPFGEGFIPQMGGAFVSIKINCIDNITPEELAALPITYADGKHDNWWNVPKITSYL